MQKMMVFPDFSPRLPQPELTFDGFGEEEGDIIFLRAEPGSLVATHRTLYTVRTRLTAEVARENTKSRVWVDWRVGGEANPRDAAPIFLRPSEWKKKEEKYRLKARSSIIENGWREYVVSLASAKTSTRQTFPDDPIRIGVARECQTMWRALHYIVRNKCVPITESGGGGEFAMVEQFKVARSRVQHFFISHAVLKACGPPSLSLLHECILWLKEIDAKRIETWKVLVNRIIELAETSIRLLDFDEEEEHLEVLAKGVPELDCVPFDCLIKAKLAGGEPAQKKSKLDEEGD